MINTTKYENVTVTLGVGIERTFDFEIGRNELSGGFARITSDKYELIIDENLAYVAGNMPEEWQKPVIARLMLLLKVNQHQDGQLN